MPRKGQRFGGGAGSPRGQVDLSELLAGLQLQAGAGGGRGGGALAAGPDGGDPPMFRACVKIFATFAEPNFTQPWAMHPQAKGTASGFIISGHQVVTNAHAVAYATSLQVRKHGDATKYTARILAVAHEVDLAVLTVEEPSFFKDSGSGSSGRAAETPAYSEGASNGSDGQADKPASRRNSTSSSKGGRGRSKSEPGATPELTFGPLPRPGDSLTVLGYPLSSDTISVTAGVVSRIDFDSYAHSSRENLVIVTDSAINPGNSGGCAVDDQGRVVGVAFQSLEGAENVGYVIPAPVVQRLLADIDKHGRVTGFGRLGASVQPLENKALRSYLGVPTDVGGVLVTRVLPSTNLVGQVEAGDVITAIDGHAVAADGTIAFRGDERISMAYILTQKFVGDSMSLSLLRKGKASTVTVPVAEVPELVPSTLYEGRPSYVVYAGLVFTPLTEPYMTAAFSGEGGGDFESSSPIRLVQLASEGIVERPGQQVVVLASILSHPANVGYEPYEHSGMPLVSINGKRIHSLLDVALTLRDLTLVQPQPEPFVRFVFEGGATIVLSTKEAAAATADVLSQHAIPSPVSDDIAKAVHATAGVAAAGVAAAVGSTAGEGGAPSAGDPGKPPPSPAKGKGAASMPSPSAGASSGSSSSSASTAGASPALTGVHGPIAANVLAGLKPL